MIYLDYSATTPVNQEVLDTFCKVSLAYPGNVNSLHRLGMKSKELSDMATKQIADLLQVLPSEIIYTSGASESNNMAILGTVMKYPNRGKHILTTHLEHSSIQEPLRYLESIGYEIEYLETNELGKVEINELEQKMRNDTVLVTIGAVNSETGVLQDINALGSIVANYPQCFFHTDMTQMVGKVPVSFEHIDMASFTAHKFYGLKGIGVLIKKEKIAIEPLIHGGKSTTPFRSGTPALPLIVSLAKALRLSFDQMDEKINAVIKLNQNLQAKLLSYAKVVINSNSASIPQILNISVLGVKPETFLHALEQYDIFISTQSACSSKNSVSEAVLEVTKDVQKASHSLRISISYLTTEKEMESFLEAFDQCYRELG